jgi:CubicO group peptidase (beta-lactamase class C family)
MTALTGIDAWAQTWQVPNTAAAVITADGVMETFGDPDRPYPLASVTKLLTAYAVLAGVEEGALGLDDPAGPPNSTVRHLLAHTAGYGFESDSPVITSPGAKRIYSNRGFEELTAHFSTVTGIAFENYLVEGVLDPLGLAATELLGSPAYGARSTVTDLCAFVVELLNPALLARETLDDAVAVHFPGLPGILPGLGRFDPLDWGLGFERNFGRPKHWAGATISRSGFGHFGASGTFLWVDPEAGVGCVCLTDHAFGDWAKQAWPDLGDAVLHEYGELPPDPNHSGQTQFGQA